MNDLPVTTSALDGTPLGGLTPAMLWVIIAALVLVWLVTFAQRRRSALARAEDHITHLERESRALRDAAHQAQSARDVAEARLSERDRSLEKLEQARDLSRAEAEDRIDDLTERATIAEREVTAVRIQLEQERIAAAEKIALLEEMREEMARNFKELADASLKATAEELTRANAERLDTTLSPLREHVAQFQAELRNVHEGALRDRQALKTEIEQLTRRSEEVSKEATALARALKGDKQRQGAWGEMILESLLERSGLRKEEEYLTQTSHTTEEGQRLRTDVIVRMPNDTCLVIDSKVSLVDYEVAVNSDDEAEANAARKRHAIAMRRHIDTLKGKTYQTVAGQSVDYVIMFVPIEGALSEALREAGDLTNYALDSNVTIATPTTLMMALRTVASFWTIDRRNRNAESIADRAGKLYDKVAGFVEEMEKVGRALGTARGSFDTAMDRLSRGRGNVLAQVDQLRELGARTTKKLASDFDPLPAALPEPTPTPAPALEQPSDAAPLTITDTPRPRIAPRASRADAGPPLTKEALSHKPAPLTLTQIEPPAAPVMPVPAPRSKPLPFQQKPQDEVAENLFSDTPADLPPADLSLPEDAAPVTTPHDPVVAPAAQAPHQVASPSAANPPALGPAIPASVPLPTDAALSKTNAVIASAVQKAMQNGRQPLRIMRQEPPLRAPKSGDDTPQSAE